MAHNWVDEQTEKGQEWSHAIYFKVLPPTTLPQEIHSLQLGSSSYAFHNLQKNSTANYEPSIQTQLMYETFYIQLIIRKTLYRTTIRI